MREVETSTGRAHGWIDLLAFEPRSRTLVIVEVKTRLDDIGAVERQLVWYERDARRVAADHGWHAGVATTWLLLLASDEVERQIAIQRHLLGATFAGRARAMNAALEDPSTLPHRGLALIDPTSRRHRWLIPSRADGRRTPSPYADYADAAARLAARRPRRHDTHE